MSLHTTKLLTTLKFLAQVPHLISAWLCTHLLSSYLRKFLCRSPEGCQGLGLLLAACMLPASHLPLACLSPACMEVQEQVCPCKLFRPHLLHMDPPARVPISANRRLLSTEVGLLLCNCWEMKTACSCRFFGFFISPFFSVLYGNCN